ncbi:hypothetical protein J6590_026726 [Homalodisca vitripennis]|nr:hypothetical protein J6590_026726 [Homalodisca vitripennis]
MVLCNGRVSGTCRPGAKLLAVTAGRPPRESLCSPIIARLSSSAVIVSTLPRRHDLPWNHALNQKIVLVNFIEELCVRYEGYARQEAAGRSWKVSLAALGRLLYGPRFCTRLLLLPLLVSAPPPRLCPGQRS